jgi:PAS domain S-box-containing protein
MSYKKSIGRAPESESVRSRGLSLDLGLQGGKVGLWDFDIETGEVFFSREWKQQIGYEDDEIENRIGEWEARLHPDDRNRVLGSLTEYLECREADYEMEFRLRHKDGSYRWIFSRAAIHCRLDGKPHRVSGCHVDITERKRLEQRHADALRREQNARLEADGARRLLGTVFERISDGFVALDTEWRYTYVNERAAEMFGRRPDDLIGRHIWTEFPEGAHQPFARAYEEALARQTFVQIEDYYAPWDRWFENRIYPSADGISIFFHEITERKRAERAAQRSAALVQGQNAVLELIARGAPLAKTLESLVLLMEAQCPEIIASILLLDTDGEHVRCGAAPSLPDSFNKAIDGQPIGPKAGSCGTAAYRRTAVIVEDIASDPLWESYREIALTHDLRACWSTPIFDSERTVLGTFALYLRTPGVPAAQHRELIEISTHTAAIAIIKDRESLERKRAAQEMARSEAQLAEAQRIAMLGSYEWNIGENKVYRSSELCRIFGLSADQFAPTFDGYLERVHPDDRAATRMTIESAFRDRMPFTFEEKIVRPDGTVRILHSQGKWILKDDGQPAKLLGICQDITDRRQAEERLRRAELLRARHEELKSFATMVSHDLKAPLRAIAGYARELERQHQAGLSERGLFCVQQTRCAANNLEQLVEDLLRYCRLDAMVATPSDVDVCQLVEAILKERAASIVESGTRVTRDLSAQTIRTWESGLHQVLANLIDNALKYSRLSIPPRLHIGGRPHADGGYRIAVSDNGIGFDMKEHDRLFDLFHRLVSANEYEGTGAGLAIVRKLVERLGGKVYAESSPGQGATFTVELPERG